MGIDFSPASIKYAIETALNEGLFCEYLCEDIRYADYGEGYDLVMFIFGEFNTFTPVEAGLILEKVFRSLAPGGRLLLEIHDLQIIKG